MRHRLTPGAPSLARLAAPLAAILAALLAGCAGPAPETSPAPAGWRILAPGLWQRDAAPGVQLLRLDLHEPRLRLGLSPHAERGQPIDAMASARTARAAFNASFFDRSFRVRGLTVSEGVPWPEPMAPQSSPLLACDAQQRCRMQLDPPQVLPPGTQTAVAGTPWLVRAGRPRTEADDAGCASFCAQPHPRTAIGLDASRRHLIVLLAEGRRDDRAGLSLAQTARLLQAHGATEAFNLDGGGSSALLLDGRAAMQRPANEPAQRPIANALVIKASAGAP